MFYISVRIEEMRDIMAERKSSYTGFTEARKEANKRYIEKHKLIETKFRTTAEEKEQFQRHAESMGESTNAFIKRAITEAIERDRIKYASEGAADR